MKKIVILIFVAGISLTTLNACSTIEGAGKDIQGAGQVLSQEAKKNKRY